ncbi:MAG: DDE-type integrase/transposase/recombinase [Roseobacter sp.]
MNGLLVTHNRRWLVDLLRVKYLNNNIEQNRSFIKKITRSLQAFKALNSAATTLAGPQVAYMFRKRIRPTTEKSSFEPFAEYAG